jgi:hypothetical protein
MLLLQLAEETTSATQQSSSSQASTKAPWDKPFTRALNKVLDKPLSKRPHKGCVVGTGVGRKHSHYYPEDKEAREERKRLETLDVRMELANMKADMPTLIDDAVAKRVNELLPTVVQSITSWIDGGRQTPALMIILGSSNSLNVAPAQNAPIILETPAANPNSGREDAPAANSANGR